MMFINKIHPTSFDLGILLHVNEQMFHILHVQNSSTYNDRHNGEFNEYSNIMRFN